MSPGGDVARYVHSAACAAELSFVRDVWATPGIVGGGGLFIFTTYATLPVLTRVGAKSGYDALMLRKVLSDGQERVLLARLTGLSHETAWAGGIANLAVRNMISTLGERHARLSGMSQEYVNFFSGIVALSGLRIRAVLGLKCTDEQVCGYWNYMSHALAIFGARLGHQVATLRSCERFVEKHSNSGPRTGGYVADLFEAYPGHALTCLPALLPGTRRVVDELQIAPTPLKVDL